MLTDVIRPIEQQVKMELSESGFRPGFHFPVFHGAVPHFNTRQLFSEVISRQDAMDEQSTRLGVVRETFFALVESATGDGEMRNSRQRRLITVCCNEH